MKFVNAMGEKYVPNRWLTFDDVLLKPQRSRFKSRNDQSISLVSALSDDVSLNIPIISANMDTVTGKEMAIAMCKYGGLGILHRFHSKLSEYAEIIEAVYKQRYMVAFSVGCGDSWVDFANEIIEDIRPTNCKNIMVCLDVAHGHMEQSLETVEKLKKNNNCTIIAGNIATDDGAIDLIDAGADILKVGVGSGSLCTTRIVTGHGVPQLSAILSIRKALDDGSYKNIGIIADGGIRNSGDIIKSLAAGADAVMIGNLFSGCDETPGEIFTMKDGPFKIYRGQSSRHFLKDIKKTGVAPEGESMEIKAKGPVENIINELTGGIRSGFTYSGVSNIYELQEKAVFMEISDHAWVESMPHALIKT